MVKKPISERYISIPEVKDIMIEVKASCKIWIVILKRFKNTH